MSVSAADLESVDIASQELYQVGVPHESFALLRREDPVHWHPWDWAGGGFWALTKHADVVAVSKDPDDILVRKGPHLPLGSRTRRPRSAPVAHRDGRLAHGRLRRIVSAAFTPKKVKDYETYTREIAESLLDAAVAKGELRLGRRGGGPASDQRHRLDPGNLGRGRADDDRPLESSRRGHLGHPARPWCYGNTTPLRLLPFNSPASYALFQYARRIGEERRKNRNRLSRLAARPRTRSTAIGSPTPSTPTSSS